MADMLRVSGPVLATILALTVGLALALADPSPAAAQQAGEAESLSRRLSQLEEQMVDLQVAVGTLQTLGGAAAGTPAAQAGQGPFASQPGPGDGGGDLAQRVEAIETQIRALTSQIEHLSEQIAHLGQPPTAAPDAGGVPPSQGGGAGGAEGRRGQAPPPQGFAGPPLRGLDGAGASGTTTVLPGEAGRPAPQGGADGGRAAPAGGPAQVAALPSGDAPELYESAFGHLLDRDYASAEAGFRRFVEQFPDHELAGNAYYWLGETYYVRGQFKPAADAFLQGYRRFSSGSKAPDSLLKLGMALNQLGQREAACDTFGELASGFPAAPDHIKQRMASERRRAGCS